MLNANKTPMKTEGICKFPIILAGNQLLLTAVIVPEALYEVIMGNDIIDSLGLIINYTTHMVQIPSGGQFPFTCDAE